MNINETTQDSPNLIVKHFVALQILSHGGVPAVHHAAVTIDVVLAQPSLAATRILYGSEKDLIRGSVSSV
jgi:hypothetical protein